MRKLFIAILAVLAIAAVILFTVFPKRAALVMARAKGQVVVARGCSVFTPGVFDHEEQFARAQPLVREIKREGNLALYDTPIGPLWYRPGAWTLPSLVEENQSDIYRMGTMVKPGDVVIDVGANVGTDTKKAVNAGAKLVIAIEPEPLTLECLRRNLAAEIRDNRVVVIAKGAWDKEDTLLLHVDEANAGGSTFMWQTAGPSISVPLTTIDRIVAELGLPKVDFIKMDIEGAEKNALLGAAETIRKYHPKLALVLEHNVNDVDGLPQVARQLWSGYKLTLTPCTKSILMIHPQVALLTP